MIDLRMEMSPEKLRADASAGLLIAVLTLPQGIAFATLAGLPPQYGIYSSIIPCVVAAVFGSSKHVVSGPTNANSLALFAALSPLAIPGSPNYIAFALAVTAFVGIIQLTVGAFRLGWVTDFIAPPVLIGFMNGAAVLIALYALPDLMGVHLETAHRPLAVAAGIFAAAKHLNPNSVIVGITTLVVTVVMSKVARRSPFMLVGLIGGYIASELLSQFAKGPPIALVGSLQSVLPPFSMPSTSLKLLPELISIAGALSIVALGQSVSIAKALAQRSHQQLDINQEIIGQGLSNIVGSFFSSYVSCGSLNRSLPNFLAGAQSSLAAVFSAGFLIALTFVSRPLLEHLPMPAIAAMLGYTAYRLIDVQGMIRLLRVRKADFVVAGITGFGILFLSFQDAILIGSVASLVLYLHHTAHPAVKTLVPNLTLPHRTFTPIDEFKEPVVECPQVKLIRIEGSIYFGAMSYISHQLHKLRNSSKQKHLLAMVESMNFIDIAGLEIWEHELRARRELGGDLYFHRPRQAVKRLWSKTGFDLEIGDKNIFETKRAAIASISSRLDPRICAACNANVFTECAKLQALARQKGGESDGTRTMSGR
jgi:SulP family sulfate permease